MIFIFIAHICVSYLYIYIIYISCIYSLTCFKFTAHVLVEHAAASGCLCCWSFSGDIQSVSHYSGGDSVTVTCRRRHRCRYRRRRAAVANVVAGVTCAAISLRSDGLSRTWQGKGKGDWRRVEPFAMLQWVARQVQGTLLLFLLLLCFA